jgi:hypothetical protein
MKPIDGRTMMLALRAWLDEDERNIRPVLEYVIDKATAGHFGFWKLVIDLADGKLRQTAEEEMTFEPDCALVVADDGRVAEPAIAA